MLTVIKCLLNKIFRDEHFSSEKLIVTALERDVVRKTERSLEVMCKSLVKHFKFKPYVEVNRLSSCETASSG